MKIAFLTLSILLSSSVFGLVDAQFVMGKRWYTTDFSGKEGGAQATEITLAAHLDPIPLVPVSGGLSYSTWSYNEADFSADSVNGYEVGLDFMAWLPMVPVITPYARFRLPVLGVLEVEKSFSIADVKKDLKLLYTTSGYHLGFGVKYPFLLVIDFLLEFNMSSQTLGFDKLADAVEGFDPPKENTFNSQAFLVGVEVGI